MLASAAVALTLFAAPAAPVPIAPVTSPAVAALATPSAFDPAAQSRANRATISVSAQSAGLLQVDIVTAGG
ncbi:MAG: hypothetical protein ACO3KD_01595, partial [Gaiellales bacterium]